jgi:hypothetical protein
MGWLTIDLVVVNQRYGRQPNFKKRATACLNANIHATTPLQIKIYIKTNAF